MLRIPQQPWVSLNPLLVNPSIFRYDRING